MTHVEGDVNPVRDLDIISEELRLKDEQYLNKQIVSVPILNFVPYPAFFGLIDPVHTLCIIHEIMRPF